MNSDRQLNSGVRLRITGAAQLSRFVVPLLLAFQFILHLLFYYNTESFAGISESGALLGKLDLIIAGAHPKPLYGFYWYFTPAYIAGFLIKVFGSINAYFVFQCLLATVTSLIVYFIVVKISGSRRSGIFSIILLCVYTEFLLLSSVFYNQVYENFFVVLFLFVLLHFTDRDSIKSTVLYGFLLVIIILASLMFRNTMLMIFFYLFLAGLYYFIFRRPSAGVRFLFLSLIIFGIVFVIRPLDYLREGEYKPPGTLEFWGHTPYGGNGGEVGFIYEENERLFNERLGAYADERNITEITPSVTEEFKRYEVRRFITREPHRWLFLQVKKVLYTFGSMPQRDGLTMLYTGKMPLGWVASAIILQVPFMLILGLFIFTVDIRLKYLTGLPGYYFLITLLGLYLISAVSIYAAYAERYRIVVMVAFIIPVTAVNIDHLRQLTLREKRGELMIRLSFAVFMALVWSYQAYEALVIHHDRYFQALERIK
jgi:hypothetical protein